MSSLLTPQVLWAEGLEPSGKHPPIQRTPGRIPLDPDSWTARKSSPRIDTWNVFKELRPPRCQFPQITANGLEDSHTHGAVSIIHPIDTFILKLLSYQDLRSVYAQRLGFGEKLDTSTAQIRAFNYLHSTTAC